MEIGNCSPEIENSLVETVALVRVTAVVPVFTTVAICETSLPTPALPKSTAAGVTCTVDSALFAPLTIPVQPPSASNGVSAANHARKVPTWLGVPSALNFPGLKHLTPIYFLPAFVMGKSKISYQLRTTGGSYNLGAGVACTNEQVTCTRLYYLLTPVIVNG